MFNADPLNKATILYEEKIWTNMLKNQILKKHEVIFAIQKVNSRNTV